MYKFMVTSMMGIFTKNKEYLKIIRKHLKKILTVKRYHW